MQFALIFQSCSLLFFCFIYITVKYKLCPMPWDLLLFALNFSYLKKSAKIKITRLVSLISVILFLVQHFIFQWFSPSQLPFALNLQQTKFGYFNIFPNVCYICIVNFMHFFFIKNDLNHILITIKIQRSVWHVFVMKAKFILLSAQQMDKSKRQSIEANNTTLFREPAGQKDGKLHWYKSQNNHVVQVWISNSFMDQRWREVRKQSKKSFNSCKYLLK